MLLVDQRKQYIEENERVKPENIPPNPPPQPVPPLLSLKDKRSPS